MASDAVYRVMREARELLDAENPRKQARVCTERCVAFRVSGECYAIELIAVREVISPPAIVAVPGASPEVLGVINLRGCIVTVINARRVLGLPGTARGPAARVLVLDEDGEAIGVVVDAVEDIVDVDVEALDPVPQHRPDVKVSQVRGAVTIRGEIALLLHRSGFAHGAIGPACMP